MTVPENQPPEPIRKAPGFLSIIPILGRLLWKYGRRLFSLDTLVALEKKQGAGSGERSVEEQLLERVMERNPHQYHVPQVTAGGRGDSLSNPVLIVKRGGSDEHHR